MENDKTNKTQMQEMSSRMDTEKTSSDNLSEMQKPILEYKEKRERDNFGRFKLGKIINIICPTCKKNFRKTCKKKKYCSIKCLIHRQKRKSMNNGYTIIPVGRSHPYSNPIGYVREHRLVMEEHLRKTNPEHPALDENGYLKKEWVVHHINGIRTDNRIENLKLTNNKEHMKFHSGENNKRWLGGKKETYKRNLEKIMDYRKRYYLKNKEIILKRNRTYYSKNKREKLTKCREYYNQNKLRILDRHRKWRKANPNYFKEWRKYKRLDFRGDRHK